MRWLAIDLGGKRTGLAAGDDASGIVSPIAVVRAAHDAELLALLVQEVAEHEPDGLVVGLPLNMDGSEGPAATQARVFAQRLQLRTGRPVHFADERLSTFAADEHMKGTGLTRQGKKDLRDALAACVFLQDFMAARKRAAEEGRDA